MQYNRTVGCVDIHIDTKRIDNNIRNAQKLLNMQISADCDEYIPMKQIIQMEYTAAKSSGIHHMLIISMRANCI